MLTNSKRVLQRLMIKWLKFCSINRVLPEVWHVLCHSNFTNLQKRKQLIYSYWLALQNIILYISNCISIIRQLSMHDGSFTLSLGKKSVEKPLLKSIVYSLVSVSISVTVPLTRIMTESWTRISLQWKLAYGAIPLYTVTVDKERLIKLMYERILSME